MNRRVFKDAKLDARFRREGYVILDLLTGEDIAQLSDFYEQFSYCHQYDFSATILTGESESRRKIHDALSAVFRRRLLAVLHKYKIILASYAVKLPQTEYSRVGLHQDFSFIDEQTHTGLSIWCPLVEVNQENGWLGVVRGSQDFNSNLREGCPLPYPELVSVIEEKYLTRLPMHPGQVLFMDNRVFHGSPANRSAHRRVVAAGVAIPTDGQLVFCHRDFQMDANSLEVYEVPDDFYVHHSLATRPREGKRLADVPRIVSPLTEAMIKARQ
ncbi:MAG TPA: phytanoyl-CoA dioxygenase family protein [Pyrinomonadaceae bacterium]|nr:phytanoyl-CoA dioxygenase family protein [Pyrinomonadaceae bacterium]